jgi:hypothetical protein
VKAARKARDSAVAQSPSTRSPSAPR